MVIFLLIIRMMKCKMSDELFTVLTIFHVLLSSPHPQSVSQCKVILHRIIRLKVKPNDPSRLASPDQSKHWQV